MGGTENDGEVEEGVLVFALVVQPYRGRRNKVAPIVPNFLPLIIIHLHQPLNMALLLPAQTIIFDIEKLHQMRLLVPYILLLLKLTIAGLISEKPGMAQIFSILHLKVVLAVADRRERRLRSRRFLAP